MKIHNMFVNMKFWDQVILNDLLSLIKVIKMKKNKSMRKIEFVKKKQFVISPLISFPGKITNLEC